MRFKIQFESILRKKSPEKFRVTKIEPVRDYFPRRVVSSHKLRKKVKIKQIFSVIFMLVQAILRAHFLRRYVTPAGIPNWQSSWLTFAAVDAVSSQRPRLPSNHLRKVNAAKRVGFSARLCNAGFAAKQRSTLYSCTFPTATCTYKIRT